MRRETAAKDRLEAGHAFEAHHADLHAAAALVGADDGNEAALDEVDMADRLARRVEDAADIELHRFEGRTHQAGIFTRQLPEQLVGTADAKGSWTGQ